jgi:hypothetical protein
LAPSLPAALRSRPWTWVGIAIAAAAGVAALVIFLPPRSVTDAGMLTQPSGLPTVAPASGSPPEIMLALGDAAACDSTADEAVAELASRLPGTIAMLGDTVYVEGTTAEYRECFQPSWGPLRSRIRPAVGNHEYRTEGAAGYFEYFGSAAGRAGEGWYSYDLGAWHVVVLNSNCAEVGCDPGSPQLEWLRADLATVDGECLLAYWHSPRWSSGRHGSEDDVAAFWETLRDAGADVVLAGHNHAYERIELDGIRQFTVGTGGRYLYPFENDPLPETVTRSASTFGLLWLALGEDAYEWEFIGLGDDPYTDAGEGTC